MKRVICDVCRKEVEPDAYGMAPKGWLSVTERGIYTSSPDYCSKACAVAALTALPAEQPPAPADVVVQ